MKFLNYSFSNIAILSIFTFTLSTVFSPLASASTELDISCNNIMLTRCVSFCAQSKERCLENTSYPEYEQEYKDCKRLPDMQWVEECQQRVLEKMKSKPNEAIVTCFKKATNCGASCIDFWCTVEVVEE